MVEAIRVVFERYGLDPVETPAIEYTDALGKFLPDQDRPNEGVFSFQDDDEQWLSLRYDLTAPLARYVAENFQNLALPYRSYRFGWVFRNEKPGPDASDSSCSLMRILSAPLPWQPMPRCACSPPTRWKRSISRAAATS